MYSKKHPVLQRLLAGALTVTMVTSGVPAAAYAEAATEVAPAQDVQATAFETQATAPTTVQIQKGYSEVTTSERPSVDDELKAVPGTMEEDYWGDEGFSALSDTSGCSSQ